MVELLDERMATLNFFIVFCLCMLDYVVGKILADVAL